LKTKTVRLMVAGLLVLSLLALALAGACSQPAPSPTVAPKPAAPAPTMAPPSPTAAPKPTAAPSPPPAAKVKTVTIGFIGDLSGPMAEPTRDVVAVSQALYNWVNETNYIPGIKLEYANEDDRYQRANIVTAYKRLQEKNPLVIQVYTGDNAEVLKPTGAQDKVPIVSYGGGTAAIDPPGWTFVVGSMYDSIAFANINWIYANWDVAKMGRKAKYVHVGWDHAMGKTAVEPSKLYVQNKLSDKIEWLPEQIVPPGTTDMSKTAIVLKDLNPDYVWMALIAPPSSSLVKSAKGLGMDLKKFIWGDYTCFMWNTVMRVLTPADVEATVFSTSFFPKSVKTPGMQRMFELWDKYVKRAYGSEIGVQVGYNPAQVIVEGIKRAVAKVGADKVDGTAVYEALQTMQNYDPGTMLPVTYGPDRRDGQRLTKLYTTKNGEWFELDGKIYDGGNPLPKDILAQYKK